MNSVSRSRFGPVASLVCGLAAGVLASGAVAVGDVVVERWSVGQAASRPATIKVLEAPPAAGVVQVDLTALPKGAKVFRAGLFVEREAADPAGAAALVPNEVYPLKAPFQSGKPPKPAGKPLPIPPPRYDCFDATAVVARSAGGTCQLLVKSLPGWIKDRTWLEVAYEGQPRQVPTQVTGLKAFHRAGQTFLTWREVAPLIRDEQTTWGEIRQKLTAATDAFSYRVYAHGKPIDAKTISAARLIARVDPLSGYNVNGRNMEHLICQAMIEPDKMGELTRNHNHYMYTWGMNSERMDRYPVERFVIDPKAGRLRVGTGLYVHSPPAAGKTYYAVVSCRHGTENTVDFSAGNSLRKPLAETPGAGEPVRQGPGLWGPYFDYPGRRQVYVQWCAPPLAPKGNMCFNWSVLVPPDLKKGEKARVELYFHSGNFSHAKPRKKYMRDSIQIAPHDFPFSGWYGYNDAFGTLKSRTDGTVSNHTQKRIIAFLEWAKGQFPLDADRIVLPGSDGAAILAMNYREVFAYVMIQGFGGGGKIQGRVLNPAEQGLFASAWGPKSPRIKDDQGRAEWGWAMLDKLARERPAVAIPPFTCSGTSWGGKRFYGSGHGPFYTAMQEEGHPVIAGHGWNKKLIPPDYYSGLWGPATYRPAMKPIDMTNKTPVPAFANSSGTHMSLQDGNVNFGHGWEDVVDEPERFQIVLTGRGKVDMTPRRIQKFKVAPGEKLRWEAKCVLVARRDKKEDYPPQSGEVVADKHGRVRLKELRIPSGKLVVTITRAK